MDSLENKLERLTPGQRREVEDFVDFLLQQSNTSPAPMIPVPLAPHMMDVAPPPLTREEPPATSGTSRINIHDVILVSGAPAPTPVYDESSPPITEIPTNSEDFLTHDYMDYGQFDQSSRQPSPATEAVRNVKMKMSRKDKEDRTSQLLDWID